MKWHAALALALLLVARAAAAQPCDICRLPSGQYRTVAPPGWDGKTRLPLLLFLHGWQSSAASTLADGDVTGPAGRQGFLLVAPDGVGKSWHFRGSKADGRDDIGFLHAVLADVETRFPIDRRLVVAAGFSIGASMVWDLACHASTGFSAFLPLSGGFWEPFPTRCETGPVNLRHTHGRADTTFPFGGRAVAGMRQGDVAKGLALWRDIDGCAAAPSAHSLDAGLACDVWRRCSSGRQLQLCRHDGGHMIEAWHLESGLIWARGLPAR